MPHAYLNETWGSYKATRKTYLNLICLQRLVNWKRDKNKAGTNLSFAKVLSAPFNLAVNYLNNPWTRRSEGGQAAVAQQPLCKHLVGTMRGNTLTPLLHKDKEVIQKFFPFRVTVQFIQLQVRPQEKTTMKHPISLQVLPQSSYSYSYWVTTEVTHLPLTSLCVGERHSPTAELLLSLSQRHYRPWQSLERSLFPGLHQHHRSRPKHHSEGNKTQNWEGNGNHEWKSKTIIQGKMTTLSSPALLPPEKPIQDLLLSFHEFPVLLLKMASKYGWLVGGFQKNHSPFIGKDGCCSCLIMPRRTQKPTVPRTPSQLTSYKLPFWDTLTEQWAGRGSVQFPILHWSEGPSEWGKL